MPGSLDSLHFAIEPRTLSLLMSLEREGGGAEAFDEASKRIKNGSLGIWEECGESIPLKWLEVPHEARYCIRRKRNLEKASGEPPYIKPPRSNKTLLHLTQMQHSLRRALKHGGKSFS